jgi:predicted AAA+ superfamily ATPase
MIHQPWINSVTWEQEDPKLKQLLALPSLLPHTAALVNAIAVNPPGILFIRGPRQAGKSTFLRQFIQKALREGLTPESIGLIEAEALESRHDLYGEIKQFAVKQYGYKLLLIDEITSLEKWWLSLKVAADEGQTENMLIICTGSSAIDISEGADLMPGRRGKRNPVDFELLPVRFADVSKHLSLEDYFLTGGFPWAINEFLQTGYIPPFVYELYSAWILGTLIKRNHATQNLGSLLNYTANRVGTGLSVSNLARDCNIGSNHSAEMYLSALELNYIILTSHWSEPGINAIAPRKNRKFYPSDPMLFHLFHDFGKGVDRVFENAQQRCAESTTMGGLVECLVASELRHRPSMFPLRHFLGKREIDFVGNEIVEVKYQNQVRIEEFAWIEKVLPGDMCCTIVTKQTRSSFGRLRAVPLRDWLIESVFE